MRKIQRTTKAQAPDFSSALQSIVAKIAIEYSDIKIETQAEFIKNYRIKLIKTLQEEREEFLSKALPIAVNWIDNQTNYSLKEELLKQAAEPTAKDAFNHFIKQLETFEIPQDINSSMATIKKAKYRSY